MKRILAICIVMGMFVFAMLTSKHFLNNDTFNRGGDLTATPVSLIDHEGAVSGDRFLQGSVETDSTTVAAVSKDTVKEVKRTEPVFQRVPFTSQAPRGEWGIGMYQDGCEEASVLMAHAWMTDQKTISSDEAVRDIRSMTQYEQGRFGVAVDLSPEDAATLFREYWKWDRVAVAKDISKASLIDTLYENAVIIVPADGKALKNPNFTAGGPDRHMLLLIGYDPKAREFVTNDPGTRKGEGYRYDEDILFGAIRAYKTGDHEPIGAMKKNVIVVRK